MNAELNGAPGQRVWVEAPGEASWGEPVLLVPPRAPKYPQLRWLLPFAGDDLPQICPQPGDAVPGLSACSGDPDV